MRRLLAVAALILGLAACLPVKAQNPGDIVLSADFTFGPLPTTAGATCSPILSWNGVADAYPENMGDVCAFFSQNIGISIPFQLGFLNNGFLFPCNQMTWGAVTYTFGDGTHAGDTYTQPASTTCPYFTDEYGGNAGDHVLAGFNITAGYTLVQKRRCVRGYKGTCFQYQYYLAPSLTGGTGTATETQLPPNQPVAALYRCGSKRVACLRG